MMTPCHLGKVRRESHSRLGKVMCKGPVAGKNYEGQTRGYFGYELRNGAIAS